MLTRTVSFLAVVFMALALVPAGAHLFALPNKMQMDQGAYFTAQQIYAGWALFGVVLFGALALNLLLTILLRGDRPAFYFAVIGFIAMLANLAVFFTWTFPANEATANWVEVPENWQQLRAQWEYSHAVNAIITFIGFCTVTLAALTARD
jgi:hypothetical protein